MKQGGAMEQLQTDIMFRNFSLGRALRDGGIAQVESNGVVFVALMRDAAVEIAKRDGTVTINDLRQYADAIGIKPHHPNVWGSVLKSKLFVPVGYTQAKLPQSHARCVRVWRLAED